VKQEASLCKRYRKAPSHQMSAFQNGSINKHGCQLSILSAKKYFKESYLRWIYCASFAIASHHHRWLFSEVVSIKFVLGRHKKAAPVYDGSERLYDEKAEWLISLLELQLSVFRFLLIES
jgi:hypothetical protein